MRPMLPTEIRKLRQGDPYLVFPNSGLGSLAREGSPSYCAVLSSRTVFNMRNEYATEWLATLRQTDNLKYFGLCELKSDSCEWLEVGSLKRGYDTAIP